MKCSLCPRNCNAIREKREGFGFCKAGLMPKIARVAPHFWEEPCISGTKGSGTVFFSHCTLNCAYCQNYEISSLNKGEYITEEKLCECYRSLEKQGVHNINLVSATPYIDAVIDSMKLYRPDIPFIFNCGGYEKVETIKKLDGYIDVFLPDFKYSDDELSLRLSNAPNYCFTALEAIKQMVKQTGKPVFDENGLIKSGVIVRHLILPNHTKNSINALRLLKENFDDEILISLMGQYVPCARALEIDDINRKITKREYSKVLDELIRLDLDGYSQELCSASEKYIPSWDFCPDSL